MSWTGGQELHKVGPFILGKTIGSGSTGKVKVAFHKDTGEKVAIKIIDKEYLSSKPSMRRKVEREIAIMKLVNHQHVLKLYDVYETDQYLFLVLELAEGGELFDYLVARGSLDPNEALKIFQQIIEGLDYCHSNLICHRDLKPENLLIDSQHNIKLADFGMGALMKRGEFLETSCGSPHYASPEVVMGIKYDGRDADIWSCGVILFALLTGKLPFDDEDMRKLLHKVKSGVFSMPQYLHKDIKDILSRMLTVDPKQRIRMHEIREHNFFKSKRWTKLLPILTVEEQLRTAIPISLDEDVDADIVKSLVSLGWGSEQEVREALLSGDPNYETVFYRLLEERKRFPYHSSPRKAKIKTRGRTNTLTSLSSSAPIPFEVPSAFGQASSTPPASPVPQRKGSISSLESPRRGRSRTKSVGGSTNPHFPRTDRIIQDGQITSEATPPSIGSPLVNRPSRLRMESSREEGSLGLSPKRSSWISSFFETFRPSPPKSSNVGVTMQSTKSTLEIAAEVEKVLEQLGVEYRYNTSREKIKAKYSMPDGAFSPVKFHIAIGRASATNEKTVFSVSVTRKSGDRHLFKDLCARLQSTVQL